MKKTWMFLALVLALSSCASTDESAESIEESEAIVESSENLDDQAQNDSDETESLGEDIIEDTLSEDNGEELADETNSVDGGEKELISENEVMQEELTEESGTEQDSQASKDSSFEVADSPTPVVINNIKYVAYERGGTVVIEGNSKFNYKLREVSDRQQIIIDIPNAALPKKLKRPFVTKDFQQNVASINAYQDPGSSTTSVVIQLRKMADVQPQREGNSLLLVTSSANGDSKDDDDSSFASSAEDENSGVSDGDIQNEMLQEEETLKPRGTVAKGYTMPSESEEQKGFVKFSGKPISLEVTDAEVKDVLELIADQAGVNLIVDDTVKGLVSIKLREVAWDQALSLILKTKNLGYRSEGDVLRVTSQETLAKEEQQRKRVADEEFNSEPVKLKVMPVSFAKVKDLEEKIKTVLSSRGKVSVDEGTSSVIISDVEEYIARAQRLIKSLDIPPRQVLIEGKIIEARDTFTRSIGVNLSMTGSNFALGDQNLRGGGTSTGNVTPGQGFNLDLTAGTFDQIGDLAAALSLYEAKNQIKVVSSPRIVTLNNKEARIRQVTQIPVTQVQATAGSIPVLSTTFKDIELLLRVEPQITFDANVILKVNVKREFAGSVVNATTGAREINTREADTSVLVNNGQTAVIGGIYQSDASEGSAGIPILKDIPVIGNLFKRTNKDQEKNELLIFLTPRILFQADQASGNEKTEASL